MSQVEPEESELGRRLAAIIDTAIDGIITIDAKGIIETINKAALSIFEYTDTEVIGQNVKILMPEPDHSQHDGYIHNYHETRKPKIIGIGRDVLGKKKGGVVFPMRLAVSEVVLNDRIIFTGIVHDMTDLKKAHEKLSQNNAFLEKKVEERTTELEEAVNRLLSTNTELEQSKVKLQETLKKEQELGELKSRFVSIASHEFRTPLASILSSAAILQKYQTEEQQPKRDKHIDRIKSSVQNLTGILEDFLSLSKLEQKVIDVHSTQFDLLSVIQESIEDIEGLLKNNQKIIVHHHGLETVLITSDKRILKNVLFNLISNAIKYSDKDVKCIVKLLDKHVVLDVIDQGIGIPLAEQKHLFTRFFRASNVSNAKGTGLGLTIVTRYLNLLKGEISFESKENVGTTFTIKLPIVLT